MILDLNGIFIMESHGAIFQRNRRAEKYIQSDTVDLILLLLTSYHTIIDGNVTTSTAINDALLPYATSAQTIADRQKIFNDYYLQVEVDAVIHVINENATDNYYDVLMVDNQTGTTTDSFAYYIKRTYNKLASTISTIATEIDRLLFST